MSAPLEIKLESSLRSILNESELAYKLQEHGWHTGDGTNYKHPEVTDKESARLVLNKNGLLTSRYRIFVNGDQIAIRIA